MERDKKQAQFLAIITTEGAFWPTHKERIEVGCWEKKQRYHWGEVTGTALYRERVFVEAKNGRLNSFRTNMSGKSIEQGSIQNELRTPSLAASSFFRRRLLSVPVFLGDGMPKEGHARPHRSDKKAS